MNEILPDGQFHPGEPLSPLQITKVAREVPVKHGALKGMPVSVAWAARKSSMTSSRTP